MPAFPQGEPWPPAFSERGHITPEFWLDNVTSLSERIYWAIQEQRYEDIPDLEDAMIAEQRHLQQQWDLAVKERRWPVASRFCDVIHR